jgi:hypothetical protein
MENQWSWRAKVSRDSVDAQFPLTPAPLPWGEGGRFQAEGQGVGIGGDGHRGNFQ